MNVLERGSQCLATALPELKYGLKLFLRLCYSQTRDVCATEIHLEPHFDVTPQLNNILFSWVTVQPFTGA